MDVISSVAVIIPQIVFLQDVPARQKTDYVFDEAVSFARRMVGRVFRQKLGYSVGERLQSSGRETKPRSAYESSSRTDEGDFGSTASGVHRHGYSASQARLAIISGLASLKSRALADPEISLVPAH